MPINPLKMKETAVNPVALVANFFFREKSLLDKNKNEEVYR